MSCRRETGFTLVELMIAIAVLAILLAIGLPGFQGVLRSNRVATATNSMLGSLSLARSEAIKNAHGAAVCASNAGSACDGATWGAGWLVWNDVNGDQLLDANETVIQYTEGKPKLRGDAAALTVAFDPRGRRRATVDQSIVLRPDECGSDPLQRTLRVMPTGQVKITKDVCL
ncbi:MAG TPA: GspH/FimT family pseudopilin [Stenotrophomonas sp.]|jgi:type IV fimbrial biogenesis protein FimT